MHVVVFCVERRTPCRPVGVGIVGRHLIGGRARGGPVVGRGPVFVNSLALLSRCLEPFINTNTHNKTPLLLTSPKAVHRVGRNSQQDPVCIAPGPRSAVLLCWASNPEVTIHRTVSSIYRALAQSEAPTARRGASPRVLLRGGWYARCTRYAGPCGSCARPAHRRP